MVKVMRAGALALLGLALAGCGTPSKFQRYDGPEVTAVSVFKSSRKMYLWSGDTPIKAYDIGLGFAPIGDKLFEGDGKTPEGHYTIDKRNPESQYHLSVGISYPSPSDIAEAKSLGREPGGDIFIHGTPTGYLATRRDWTWGCISVQNHEIEEIYAMVRDGTPISIYK